MPASALEYRENGTRIGFVIGQEAGQAAIPQVLADNEGRFVDDPAVGDRGGASISPQLARSVPWTGTQ